MLGAMKVRRHRLAGTVVLFLVGAALGGCSFQRYDKGAAAKLAVATGLGSDTPPGFVRSFGGAVPDGVGGPALVPTQPSAGSGGFWLLADGGAGLSEEVMMTFYVERMMQHALEHIEAECSGGGGGISDDEASREVDGWGGTGPSRYRIRVTWSGSAETEWHLNQELVINKRVKDYPPGKVLAYRCRFVPDSVLLNLAAKYGYNAQPIPVTIPKPTLPPKNNPT
jgi:hypothetical protein